ncbi:MAG: Lipase 1 [Candidatus Saccharibacteria bacterium]|nr:Lipase 1 [Candidatus Saccharibacteria bacterium]
MKSTRRWVLTLSFLVSLTVLSTKANAISDFDDNVRTAPDFDMACAGSSQTEDWEETWFSKLKQAETDRKLTDPTFETPAMDYHESHDTNIMLEMWPSTSPYGAVTMFIANPEATLSFGGHGAYTKGMIFHDLTDLRRVVLFTNSQSGSSSQSGCAPINLARAIGDDTLVEDGVIVGGGGSFQSMSDGNIFYPNNPVYQFINLPITYPVDYVGDIIPTHSHLIKYVALGDSFSSGEGNPPFETGTDSTNLCHRSVQSWPRLVQKSLNLGPVTSRACSGAVTDYIIDSYNIENIELPQAAYISEDTELVTITTGGNDVGFGDVLRTCTKAYKPGENEELSTEDRHNIEHEACINAIEDARLTATGIAFQEELEDVFSGLRDLGSSSLQVVVAGYPNLFPAYVNIVGTCKWEGDWVTNAINETSGRNVASDEITKARLLHDELNGVIEDAVDATNDSNIHFVDPSATFAGHELCRPNPWFHGVVSSIDETEQAMSYHPNSDGQAAYASVLESEIDGLL